MQIKRLIVPLLLGCLLLLAGCDGDSLTDKQRLEGVNQAGAEHDMVFRKVDEVPDMPNGAVLIFDADDRKQMKTEAYFESNGFLLANMTVENPFFICEQKRVLVVMRKIYTLYEDPFMAEMVDHTYFTADKKIEFVLTLQKMDQWILSTAEENAEYLSEICHAYFNFRSYQNGCNVGQYFFEQTHDLNSPYSIVDQDTPDAAIDQMFYNSLRETQYLVSSTNTAVPIGNKVDLDALPDGIWYVYNIPYRIDWSNSREATQMKIQWIKEDFQYLLNPQ